MINGKKFSLKIDAALQNLNALAEIEIPANQKLMALATQGINNFIVTKFFKRTFLNENNIRYSNSELRFLADAFMSTEKITFIEKRRNTPSFSYGDISRHIDIKKINR